MIKIFLQIVAIILIIAGLIIFPLPIPIGIILFMIGIALLIFTNHKFRGSIKKLRSNNPKIDTAIHNAKKYMPKVINKAIQDTEPN